MNTRLLPILLALWTGVSGAAGRWDPITLPPADATEMTVYRSPTCGCCGKWLDHVKKHGFQPTDVVTEDMNTIKKQLGVPANLASCHTAVVGGHVVEGHVPAGDIRKMLSEKPLTLGLTAPGMPQGSPGMDMGPRQDAFTILSFDRDGRQVTEYHAYPAN